MVSQDEIIDCVNRAEHPVSLEDVARDIGLPWNETTRKGIDKKVQSAVRFDIIVKIQDGKKILITIKKEDPKSEN